MGCSICGLWVAYPLSWSSTLPVPMLQMSRSLEASQDGGIHWFYLEHRSTSISSTKLRTTYIHKKWGE